MGRIKSAADHALEGLHFKRDYLRSFGDAVRSVRAEGVVYFLVQAAELSRLGK